MNQKEDNVKQLFEALHMLDEMTKVDIPTKEQIKTMTIQHETKQRKTFLKEFILYLFIAFILLMILMTLLVQLPLIFFIIQLLCLLFLPLLIRIERDNDRVKEELYS